MTGRIISFHDDPHAEAQALLPWFVTGRLDAAERSRVETHLAQCAACQAQERLERGLSAGVRAMPLEADQAWALLRARLEPQPRRASRLLDPSAGVASARRAFGRAWRATPPWLGGVLAAQLLLVALVIAAPRQVAPTPAIYHTLGAPRAAAPGNLVVIFRADAREADMRAALRAAGARLVDGPTAADAYLLRVAAGDRAAAVATLRRRADIVLAEPVDSDDPP